MHSDDVIRFWFEEYGEKEWFSTSAEFDKIVTQKFGRVHEEASRGELFSWRHSPKGRLAEVIILDQFSRQIYRQQARAFAQDRQALILAQEIVIRGEDMELEPRMRAFVYLPYMHAESVAIQQESLRLAKGLGEEYQEFALKHAKIVELFGRYPYRNAVLGRPNTEEEDRYLEGEVDRFGQ